MRRARLVSIMLLLTFAAVSPLTAQQQPSEPRIPLPMQPAPPGPYKPVAITLPQPVGDPTFEAFRKEVAEIAKRKDRSALAAKVVTKGFFWQREDSNDAETKKPPIDNLAGAIGLDSADGAGWQALASYAAEPTASALPEMKGVICGPATPDFNEQEMEQVALKTRTDIADWGYPTTNGVEVRAKPEAGAPVVEKLGMVLVRTLPDDNPTNDWIKIVTPSGKTGYASANGLAPVGSDQLCYQKEGATWKIAGYVGGGMGGGQE